MAVATTDTTYADGDWHHVALGLDRTSQRLMLCVDGEPAQIAAQCGSCGTLATDTALDVPPCDGAADWSSRLPRRRSPHRHRGRGRGRALRPQIDSGRAVAGTNQLTIDATDLRAHTRSTEFGLMLEDISRRALRRARTQPDLQGAVAGQRGTGTVPYWSLLQQGGATGSFAVETSHALNDAIDRSLDVHVDSLGAGGRLAVADGSYYAVAVGAEHDVQGLAVGDGDRRIHRPAAHQPGEARRDCAGEHRRRLARGPLGPLLLHADDAERLARPTGTGSSCRW
jgi:hypothetical protein